MSLSQLSTARRSSGRFFNSRVSMRLVSRALPWRATMALSSASAIMSTPSKRPSQVRVTTSYSDSTGALVLAVLGVGQATAGTSGQLGLRQQVAQTPAAAC